MEGKFNRGRRNFLRTGALAGASTFVPGVVKNFFDKEENTSEKELTVEDYLTQIEKINYNPEEAPEYLREYAKQFSDWKEVANAQKNTALEYLNSSFLEQKIESLMKETFTDLDIGSIKDKTKKLIAQKIAELEKQEFIFEVIKHPRMAAFQHPLKEEVVVDTLKMRSYDSFDEEPKDGDFKKEKTDMFIILHEIFHSIQEDKLVLSKSVQNILDILLEEKILSEGDFRYCNRILSNKRNINELGALEEVENFDFLDYQFQPKEMLCLLYEIKNTLFVISQTKPDLLNFDIYKANAFNAEHYEFLENNQDKIFGSVKTYNKKDKAFYNNNLFILFNKISKENFINLMNEAV